MSDSDEEMEMPVVKTRLPQRVPPRPPVAQVPNIPRRVTNEAPRVTPPVPVTGHERSSTNSPKIQPNSSIVSPRGTNSRGVTSPRAMKSPRNYTNTRIPPSSSSSEQVEALRQQNERLRGLVTSLTSRLELLELNQTMLVNVCDEVKAMKEALNESPAFAKKDRSSVLDRSSLIPVLQRGTTSDASEILDLIENDKAIYYSGWMIKKGRKVRNWKRRWFILKGHRLSYFAKENDKASLGEINLETCMVDELKEREESGRPCMALLVEGRKLLFCADAPEENLRWYLYLMCKNSELSYLRKLKHTNQRADNRLLHFLEQPMTRELRLSNNTLSIDSVVALTGPVRIHDTLSHLSLRYAKLNDLAISTLCEAAKFNKSIETLDLEGNNITADGARAISLVLDADTPLKTLILKENQIGDKGVEHLAVVLSSGSNAHLERLDLTNNRIEEKGARSYATALANVTKIVDVELDDNRIGNAGTAALLELCEKNSAIQILRLQNNGITDDGILGIVETLKSNTSLKRLYLAFNTLSNASYEGMIRTLMINRTLEFVEFADYRLETTDLCSLRLLNDCNLLKLS